ncbi:hypothetical protein Y032_0413g1008 [Ancylostoma ceylanicum]|uniref:Uncharacterized protein n=1 Tax=Ancylostoma ceylanicum TaxID=53326 RepID=A0A016X306_9BILA|nr:hypothetical protein Y032_0413g1008 [Ancylostoma ceylanicum]
MGSTQCYYIPFQDKVAVTPSHSIRKKQQAKVYRCVQCAVGGSHVQVDVVEDEFQSNPCMLPHRCIPRRWVTSKVERFMYSRAQEIRKDPKYADSVVRKLWQDMLDSFPTMSDLE